MHCTVGTKLTNDIKGIMYSKLYYEKDWANKNQHKQAKP